MARSWRALCVAAVVMLSAGCVQDANDRPTPGSGATVSPTAVTETGGPAPEFTENVIGGPGDGGTPPPPTPTLSPADQLATVCGENPSPAAAGEWQVAAPRPNDTVHSPLMIQGVAHAGGVGFWVEIRDARGSALSAGSAPADSMDLAYDVAGAMAGCLWIFTGYDTNYVPQHALQIPILLEP